MSKKKESMKENLISDIQQKILSGEIKMGEKLPTERQLCESYKVSRQVVNSAVSELQRRGFLKVKPRHGIYASDFRFAGDMNTLKAIMEYRGEDLGIEEIKSILQVRWGIEHLTLKNVIDKATDEDIEMLQEIVLSMGKSEDDEEVARLAHEYQHFMAIIGGNLVLPLIISSFKPSTDTLWRRFIKLYGRDTLYKNTIKAYSFLQARDFEGAVKWLTENMIDVIEGDHQIYSDVIAKENF